MIGWTTASDEPTAKWLADRLVESKLAACVQVSGPIMSHYQWEGKTEIAQEYQLSVKYLANNGKAILDWLHQNHPYEVPEWVAIQVDCASADYFKWAQSVAPERFD